MTSQTFRLRRLVLLGVLVLVAGAAGVQVAAQSPSPSLAVVMRGDPAGDVVAFVDPVAGKIVSKVVVGHTPAGIDVSADGKSIYVCIEGEKGQGDAIAIVDVASRKEVGRIRIGDGAEPHEVRAVGGKVYFAGEGSRTVGRVDPAANRLDWHVGLGQRGPHMMAVTRSQDVMAAANPGSGNVSIVANVLKGLTGIEITQVPVGESPEGIDISPNDREVWVTNEGTGGVTIIDIAKKAVTGSVDLKTTHANRLRFTPDGSRAVIVDRHTGELVVVDVAARKLLKKIKLPDSVPARSKNQVMDIAIDRDGSHVYITVNGAPGKSYIGVIDMKTLEVARRIETGTTGDSMAWAQSR